MPQLVAYALTRSFSHASHHCGHNSPPLIPVYMVTGTDLSGVGPKWLQYCALPVTVYTAIGGEELWPQWWLTWLKLRVKA